MYFNEKLSHALVLTILSHIRSNWARFCDQTSQTLDDLETNTLFQQAPPTTLSLCAISEIFQIQVMVHDLKTGQQTALTPAKPEKLFFVRDSRGHYYIDPNRHSGFSILNPIPWAKTIT